MTVGARHAIEPWPGSVREARRIQERLRDRVERDGRIGRLRRVAGVDAHYGAEDRVTWAAVAVVGLPGLILEDQAIACRPTGFLYVPGFLSFRETPAVLDCIERLEKRPDLLLVDGHGIAHPRRFGIACHVGVLTGIPTIGVAKSRLVGRHRDPGTRRGEWSPLVEDGEVVGAVLRTRDGVRPVYVSIGHRVNLDLAIDLTLQLTPRYRLPEPIRQADRLSRRHPR